MVDREARMVLDDGRNNIWMVVKVVVNVVKMVIVAIIGVFYLGDLYVHLVVLFVVLI